MVDMAKDARHYAVNKEEVMDCITVSKEHYEELITKASRYDALMDDLRPALSKYKVELDARRSSVFGLGPVRPGSDDRLMRAEMHVLAVAAVGAGVGL